MSTQLQAKAMLVELKITSWSGRAMDQAATLKVTSDAGADDDAATVHKRLIDRKHLKRINAIIQKARDLHKKLTLPWNDKGMRLLPVAMHEKYVEKLTEQLELLVVAVNTLCEGYQDAIAEAETFLGDLWQAEDYPSEWELRRKFTSGYEFSTVPDGSHFIADIGEEEASRIRRDIERFVHRKLDAAVADLFARLNEAVHAVTKQIAPREDGRVGRVHESVIEALQGLAESALKMNLTGDPSLTKLCNEIRLAMAGLDAEQLRPNSRRYNEDAHKQVRKDLAGVQAKLAGYFGDPKGAK